MSDTPEYMLKPGVTISDDILLWGPNMVAITVRDKQGIYQGSIGRELFERAFIPLDRQALTKQIEKILDGTIANMYITGEEVEYKEICSRATGEILRLFGLENKESEK